MTEALRPATAECLACGREFVPRKLGHVYCSHECRHKGPLSASERVSHDQEAVDRLFDRAETPTSGSARTIGTQRPT